MTAIIAAIPWVPVFSCLFKGHKALPCFSGRTQMRNVSVVGKEIIVRYDSINC